MQTVAIRELNHHMSKYIKKVKSGERIVITERNMPVADIVPHQAGQSVPSWKRPIDPVRMKGEPASRTIIRMRREERA
ncbi:MAG: type II toxin-antitoxin system prevent-host-death family antitoxin [Candidatus Omnitrophica bacterium]|nr:type II toxin-antitoxin system prevent-host-death family antitoxin [Candidatus Omnitrophota bacterium]